MSTVIQGLRTTAVEAKRRMDELVRNRSRGSGLQCLLDAAGDLATAKKALAGGLANVPEIGFALRARTSDGRVVMFNKSPKRSDAWQLTRFDHDSQPTGDSQHTDRVAGIVEMLSDIDLSSLEDYDGLLRPISTPLGTLRPMGGLGADGPVDSRRVVPEPTGASCSDFAKVQMRTRI